MTVYEEIRAERRRQRHGEGFDERGRSGGSVKPGERRPPVRRAVRCDGCKVTGSAPVGEVPEGWTKSDKTRGAIVAKFCPACSQNDRGLLLLLSKRGGRHG